MSYLTENASRMPAQVRNVGRCHGCMRANLAQVYPGALPIAT